MEMRGIKYVIDKKNIETLCHHCLGDYLEAGMIVTKVPGQKYKGTCTYCQRGMGWDYEVKPAKNNTLEPLKLSEVNN